MLFEDLVIFFICSWVYFVILVYFYGVIIGSVGFRVTRFLSFYMELILCFGVVIVFKL